MAINYDALMNWTFNDLTQSFTASDTILYALGLGIGSDPIASTHLRFTYESGLIAFPTMPVILANVAGWLKNPAAGVDYTQMLHADQSMEILAPIPVSGTVLSQARVVSVVDKGGGRGAIIVVERTLYDTAGGQPLARMRASSFARADGGFGGPETSSPKPQPLPNRAPDLVYDIPTLPQAALIYRLSGDDNPIHADPGVAKNAGFKRPILHGLLSFGIAGRAIIETCCLPDPSRLKTLGMRFAAPAFPGETLRTELWHDEDQLMFRVRVTERDAIIINNGWAVLSPDTKGH